MKYVNLHILWRDRFKCTLLSLLRKKIKAFGQDYVLKMSRSSMENPSRVLSSWVPSFYSTFSSSKSVLSWTRIPSGPIKPLHKHVAPMTSRPQLNESGLCKKPVTRFLSKHYLTQETILWSSPDSVIDWLLCIDAVNEWQQYFYCIAYFCIQYVFFL